MDALLILGGNPVYNAPADWSFADKLKKVPFRPHLALHFERNKFSMRLAHPRGSLPRILGRRAGIRRHRQHHPAAHRSTLSGEDRTRSLRPHARTGNARPTTSCGIHWSAFLGGRTSTTAGRSPCTMASSLTPRSPAGRDPHGKFFAIAAVFHHTTGEWPGAELPSRPHNLGRPVLPTTPGFRNSPSR